MNWTRLSHAEWVRGRLAHEHDKSVGSVLLLVLTLRNCAQVDYYSCKITKDLKQNECRIVMQDQSRTSVQYKTHRLPN